MLVLLFIFLLFSSFLLYKFFKSILSPSFLFCGFFSFGCLFAIIGNISWKVRINPLILFVIFVSSISIFVGEYVGRIIVNSRTDVIKANEKFLVKEKEALDDATEVNVTGEEAQETEDNSSKDADDSSTGINPDLKDFLDSYEKFVDEYCVFMEKYYKADA